MKKICTWGTLLGVVTLGVAQATPVAAPVASQGQDRVAPAVAQQTEQLASTSWLDWFNIGTSVLGTVIDTVKSSQSEPPQDNGEVSDPSASESEAGTSEQDPAVNGEQYPTSGERGNQAPSRDGGDAYDKSSHSGGRSATTATWQERYAENAAYSDYDFWEKPYRYVLNDSVLDQAVAVADIPLGWLVEGSAWPISVKGDYSWAYGVISSDGNTWAYLRQSPDQPVASFEGSLTDVSQKNVAKALDKCREEMAGPYAGKCSEIDISYNTYDMYEVEGLVDDYKAKLQDVVAVRRLGYRQGYAISLDDRDILAFVQGPFDLVERKGKRKNVVEFYPLDGLAYVYSELDIKPRQFRQVAKLNTKLCAGYYGTLNAWNTRRRAEAEKKAFKVSDTAVYSPKDLKQAVDRLQYGRCYLYTNSQTGSQFSLPAMGAEATVWFDKNDNVVVVNQDADISAVQGLESGTWVRGKAETTQSTVK